MKKARRRVGWTRTRSGNPASPSIRVRHSPPFWWSRPGRSWWTSHPADRAALISADVYDCSVAEERTEREVGVADDGGDRRGTEPDPFQVADHRSTS